MTKPNKKVLTALLISSVLAGCASRSSNDQMTRVLIGNVIESASTQMDSEASPREGSSESTNAFLSESNTYSDTQVDNSEAVIASHRSESRSTSAAQDSYDDVPRHYSESGSYQQETYNNEDTYSNDVSDSDYYQDQNNRSISPSSGKFSQELQFAIMMGDVEKAKKELQAGASVHAVDENGFTAIHSATMAHTNGGKIIALLARYGADPNKKFKDSDIPPLHFASNAEIAEALIKAGADIHVRNSLKQTLLHSVSKPDVAKVLLKAGIDLHAKDQLSQTALHTVTEPEIVKILLRAGLSPHAKNQLGEQPVAHLKAGIKYFNDDTDVSRKLKRQYQDSIDILEQAMNGEDWDNNYSVGQNDDSNDQSHDRMAAYDSSSYDSHSSNSAVSADPSIPQHYSSSGYNSANALPPAASVPVAQDDFNDEADIDFDAAEQEAEKLEAAQVCPMQSYDWYYTGKECQNELAHGQGKAINPFEGMYFEGTIEAGQPTEGTLYRNNKELFEGAFKNGKPNGEGICFFEGSPEECKYYKGQRIDSLHKQRQEFDRQRRLNNQSRPSNNY